jgi:hypothetical protein
MSSSDGRGDVSQSGHVRLVGALAGIGSGNVSFLNVFMPYILSHNTIPRSDQGEAIK